MSGGTPEEIPASRIAVLPDGNIAVQDGDELVVVDISDPVHPSVAARGDGDFDYHGQLDVGDQSVMIVDPTDPDLSDWIGKMSQPGRRDGDS
jgi:hypothetical protein